MRTTRLRQIKIILSCSRHATQAAREQGSDLVDCWCCISIKSRNTPDGHFDRTGWSAPPHWQFVQALSKPLEEPNVFKFAFGELSVNPRVSLRLVCTTRGSPHQWRQLSHSAAPYRKPNTSTPSKVRPHPSLYMSIPAANQVLNNESYAISADQVSVES
jgi:hypothetical protein